MTFSCNNGRAAEGADVPAFGCLLLADPGFTYGGGAPVINLNANIARGTGIDADGVRIPKAIP